MKTTNPTSIPHSALFLTLYALLGSGDFTIEAVRYTKIASGTSTPTA